MWKLYVQIIPFEEGFDYKYDIFDVTKVVLHEDYPLIPVGRMVLDRNPKNYIAQVESLAFSPANLVPGSMVRPIRCCRRGSLPTPMRIAIVSVETTSNSTSISGMARRSTTRISAMA